MACPFLVSHFCWMLALFGCYLLLPRMPLSSPLPPLPLPTLCYRYSCFCFFFLSLIFSFVHFPSSTVFFRFVLSCHSFYVLAWCFCFFSSFLSRAPLSFDSVLILFIVFVAKHQANFSMCLFYTTHSLLIIIVIIKHSIEASSPPPKYMCRIFCLLSSLPARLSCALSIHTPDTAKHREPKCTNNIQCFEDRSLTQFFLLFSVRFDTVRVFPLAVASLMMMVVVLLLLLLLLLFFHFIFSSLFFPLSHPPSYPFPFRSPYSTVCATWFSFSVRRIKNHFYIHL